MPIQQKEYLVHHGYASLYSGVHEGNDFYYETPIVSIETIIQQLKRYILNQELEQIQNLLNSDFIHAAVVDSRIQSDRHNEVWQYENYQPPYWQPKPSNYHLTEMSFGQTIIYPDLIPRKLISYQSDTYYYNIHNVQPVLEVLISQNHFQAIYEMALNQKNSSLDAILACMSHKSFINADFSSFDLSGADLTCSNLSGAQFGTINQTNLTGATISESLTKEQLYTVKTYQEAILPKGYRPFWTNETKTLVQTKLHELSFAANQYETSHLHAYKKAHELANALQQMLDAPDAKYHEQFQDEFLDKINEYTPHFKHAPLLQAWVASITLFLVTAGIGYLAALGVRAYNTGNYSPFFFNQTKIEQSVNAIKDVINESSSKCKPTGSSM